MDSNALTNWNYKLVLEFYIYLDIYRSIDRSVVVVTCMKRFAHLPPQPASLHCMSGNLASTHAPPPPNFPT